MTAATEVPILQRADHQPLRPGVMSKVKVIKRRAYGLPRFDGFRKCTT
jgi:hypothetical protein